MNKLKLSLTLIIVWGAVACSDDEVTEKPKWAYRVVFVNEGDTGLSYARVKAAVGYVDIADNFTLAVSLSKNVFDRDDDEYYLAPNGTIEHTFDSLVYTGCKVSVRYTVRRLIDFDTKEQGPRYSYAIGEKVISDPHENQVTIVWPRDSALFRRE